MNLADIRKKAQKDRGNTTVPPAGSVDPYPEEQLPYAELLMDDEPEPLPLPAEIRPQVKEPAPVQWQPEPVMSHDPLELILAGREAAGLDDDVEAGPSPDMQYGADPFQEFLCFRVSSEKYAINILDIKEIIKPREITEVPRVPSYVSGVLSLRGIIIPVFNMRKRLGLPVISPSPKERIIVIKKGDEFCGLLVDEVIQVVRIVAATIEQTPTVLDAVDKEFVSGIGRYEGVMLILLNLENILDVNLC
jgi:purine-binding chemotaxis protein CheW